MEHGQERRWKMERWRYGAAITWSVGEPLRLFRSHSLLAITGCAGSAPFHIISIYCISKNSTPLSHPDNSEKSENPSCSLPLPWSMRYLLGHRPGITALKHAQAFIVMLAASKMS
jgi:hypothetical protein